MDDQSEYLPPTQSQKTNIFAGSIPNAETASRLVDTATKCFATSPLFCVFSRNHARALSAFVMVSCVVKVFDAIINNVVSGSTFFNVSAMCVPSTFETKYG